MKTDQDLLKHTCPFSLKVFFNLKPMIEVKKERIEDDLEEFDCKIPSKETDQSKDVEQTSIPPQFDYVVKEGQTYICC